MSDTSIRPTQAARQFRNFRQPEKRGARQDALEILAKYLDKAEKRGARQDARSGKMYFSGCIIVCRVLKDCNHLKRLNLKMKTKGQI